MPKKIIDVVPVEEITEEKTDVVEGKKRHKPGGSKNFLFWISVEAVLLCGLVAGIVLGLTFKSKLTVVFSPVQEDLLVEESVDVNVGQVGTSSDGVAVAGRFFERESVIEKENFLASGRDMEAVKARGVIRVYNNFTPPRSVFLIPQTRFLSKEEKIFRVEESISLPPATVDGKKVIPTFKDVKVVAQEPGEDYNIGPSKFSVPGLKGRPLYYSVWGESTKPMGGGSKKEVSQVSAEDLANAKSALEQQLKQQARSDLKSVIPSGFILLDQAISEDNPRVTCSLDVGQKAQSFDCGGSLKVKGLAFSAPEMMTIIKGLLSRKASSTAECRPETIKTDFLLSAINNKEGKMTVNVKTRCMAQKKFDKKALSARLAGKSADEMKGIISANYTQIKNVELKFWPFWIRRAPQNPARIEARVKFGD